MGGIGCGTTTASETDDIGPPPSKKQRTSARKKKKRTYDKGGEQSKTDESDHELEDKSTSRRAKPSKRKQTRIKGLSLKKQTKRRRKGLSLRRSKGIFQSLIFYMVWAFVQ